MADVRFEHVYKRYGAGGSSPDVISDLNLHIHDQEFLVLVGPSGCGKSTALRMIAGLEEVTQGDLYIGERRVNDVAPKDRDIAMVFQNYALYPHMSVYDNMSFGLKLRRLPRREIEQRVQKAAGMLGIGEYLARRPRELSGGQRQRVALGRALVRDPQVFLLDEPLSNLDAKLRVQTRAEISRLHQVARTTFVYVTHDQVEAMTMGDRIAVLYAGVVQQLGTPQELYDTPANLFVASFIGSPAMNFFAGRLSKGGDAGQQGGAAVQLGDGAASALLPLSGLAADAAMRYATGGGRPIIVGIRPEDLHLAGAEGQGDEATVAGPVDVVEHLGNEQLIYVRLPGAMQPETVQQARGQNATADPDSAGGTALASGIATTVRVPAREAVRPGDHVRLRVDTSRIHLFDPATADRLR